MGKYASIDMRKLHDSVRESDLKDPPILIHGYGGMKLSQLKKLTKDQCEHLTKLIKDEEYERASYITHESNGTLILFIRSLDNITQDIKKLSSIIK
jgi:hypothetical protein